MTDDSRHQLEHHFREQQRFADGYSPLYARLFGIVADWPAGEAADPLVDWLVAASADRAPFDVTLLLLAALHHDVLAGEASAQGLSRYYPTARVSDELRSVRPRTPTSDEFRDTPDVAFADEVRGTDGLESALREAILGRQDAHAEFIRRATVQTNETGRGPAWLLPVACLGWAAIHLVELGASAGLNLVAERQSYRLVDAAEPSRILLEMGNGHPPEFTTLVRGEMMLPPSTRVPTILSRIGGDVAPFHLRTAEDELTLASFVWGDQPQRMARLREGIAALRSVEASAAPVSLLPLRLPDELPAFLESNLPRPLDAPVVIYNTTITMYLPERGAALRRMIGDWAVKQHVPVLWLQWEPVWNGDEPPEPYWLEWTADYWPNGGSRVGDWEIERLGDERRHRHWRLGWVHAHGGALAMGPDWAEFLGETM